MSKPTDAWNGDERRGSEDHSKFVADITDAFREAIAGLAIPAEMHREDHAFLREWREEIRVRKESREQIRARVFGWAIVTAIGSIGTGVYHAFLYVKEHLK